MIDQCLEMDVVSGKDDSLTALAPLLHWPPYPLATADRRRKVLQQWDTHF